MASSALKLGDSLTARVENGGEMPVVHLAGKINETCKFEPVAKLSETALRIDLSKVTRINSLGVRHWVNFVEKCERDGVALTFDSVSPMMVLQASMILRFMGSKARVTSLLAPYFCTSCETEHLHRVEVMPPTPVEVPPSIKCPKCGATAELDELITTYANLFGT